MTGSTFTVSQGNLQDLTTTLNTDATIIPAGVVTYLRANSRFESVELTIDELEDTLTLTTIGNGDYIVVDSTSHEAWFVAADTAATLSLLPEVEHRGFSDTDIEYEYAFDTGPLADETAPAAFEPSPIQRLEEPVEITHLTLTNGIGVPYEWQGLTATDEPFYLRERSGTIQARLGGDYGIDGTQIYEAFIGGEFPGTPLSKEEIINTIDSVTYIDISADLPDVPSDRLDEMFNAYMAENKTAFDEVEVSDDLFQDSP